MEAEFRRASDRAMHLISDIFEARTALIRYERTNEPGDARAFIECLYVIEDATGPARSTNLIPENVAVLLAGDQPVQFGSHCPCASAHEAIFHLAKTSIGHVAFEIACAGRPDLFKPGVEYECPPLVGPDDIMEHIAVATKAFQETFPTDGELNRAQALREIELARAIRIQPIEAENLGVRANDFTLFPNGTEHLPPEFVNFILHMVRTKGSVDSQAERARKFNRAHADPLLAEYRRRRATGDVGRGMI